MSGQTTELDHDDLWTTDADDVEQWALVIAWYRDAPERVGEVALLPERGNPRLLGRGGGTPEDDAERLVFERIRPGRTRLQAPLTSRGLSRRQLLITPGRSGLEVTNAGRCAMRVGRGAKVQKATLKAGGVLHLEHQLVLLVTRRLRGMPALQSFDTAHAKTFGQADDFGLVGEAPATWALRDRLAFMAQRAAHVLIHGPSGVGKELAARAIHRMSRRYAHPWIARNAATIPDSLIDAELFGNVRDYPNPGMRERAGLIGEADGGSLFLDEIGEIPEPLQAHLLRVLDAGGEYQRLGDAKPRSSDFRLVAATNRDPAVLKHDLAARLPLRVAIDGLNGRREDVPLLAHHLLHRIAAKDPELGARFFEGWGTERAMPRLAPEFLAMLLQVDYTHHTRQLEGLLWRSLASSPGRVIGLTDEVLAEMPTADDAPRDPNSLTEGEIRDALAAHEGHRANAATALGLKNRDALYRLMKKFGIS